MLINFNESNLALTSLFEIFDTDIDDLTDIIKNVTAEGDDYIDYLITSNVRDIINNSYIKVFHVTSILHDDISLICNKGVVNLRENLINDSELKRFLLKNNITIDLKTQTITINNYKVNLPEQTSHEWFLVKNRLFKDYNVNAFFFINNQEFKYSNIERCPEFISTLNYAITKELFTDLDLVNKWNRESNPFIIEADVPVKKLIDGSVDNKPLSAKKLLLYMLDRAKYHKETPDGEDTVYFGIEEIIAPKEIKNITKAKWE